MKRKTTFISITQQPKPRKKKSGGKRKGAGRPKIMAEAVYIGVRLDRPDYDRMVAEADAEAMTLAELVRGVVCGWLRGRGNPLPARRGRLLKS